jgi:uncharacterized protein
MDMFKGCNGRQIGSGLQWLSEPPRWGFTDGALDVDPKGFTDYFRPFGGAPNDNASFLYTMVRGDFTVITAASAIPVGFGDAAVLAVRTDPEHWAKLCVERSPLGEVAIVSVVTNRFSDDANNELLPDARAMLRITRKGNVFGMHFSRDGRAWRFVRTFGMEMPAEIMVGLVAQAPFGPGCKARFTSFSVEPGAVENFRSGE